MKKLLCIIMITALSMAFMSGCGAAPATASPSATPSTEPIATTPPDAAPTPEPASADLDEDAMPTTVNGRVYYLNIKDPAVTDFNEDPPLCVMNEDASENQDLGIRGFQFSIIGDYIYVDANDTDVNASGTQTWGTTRMGLDGANKVKLEYASMSVRFVPEGEQSFYFTTAGDCAIYVSDFACENVKTLPVTLPDKSELDSKIGTDNVLQLTINKIENGTINFDATFSTADGLAKYNGNYDITEDGATIKKVKGTYYSYGSQENE